MTISVEPEIAEYLRSKRQVSATIEEAVREHQSRVLERTLEQAYREDAEEARRLDTEWRSADAEVVE